MNLTFKSLTIIILLCSCILNAQMYNPYGDSLNRIDDNGLKQGRWKKEYDNGSIMYEGFFKNGKPVGIMKRYYEDSIIQSYMIFDATGTYASTKIYYNNGELAAEGKYINQQKDSIWTSYSYYSKKITATDSYKNGLKNGLSIMYYEDGKITEKQSYINGVKEGISEQYFPNSNLKQSLIYKNGRPEGEYKSYYVNGALYSKGSFKNGLKNGKWEFYNEDGKSKQSMGFTNGISDNVEELEKMDQEYFKNVDENKGKFSDPTVDDIKGNEILK